mgnify:CR=1 FL=1
MLISLSAEARTDADEATDWYLGEGAFTAADHFADELDHAFGLLRQFPNMGAPGPHQTRILPLPGFPYSLVYRIQSETVRIIAIAHQSRRPVFWVGRR